MTIFDQRQARSQAEQRPGEGQRQQFGQDGASQVNVGQGERIVSIAAGSILALLGLSRRSVPGVVIAAIGGGMVYRGVSGHCPAYQAFDIDTSGNAAGQHRGAEATEESVNARGIHVEQVFTINKPPEELYQFWRNFENLPRIMTHLESVRVSDDRRSHWTAKTSRITGQVDWDAEITADEPNQRIAWRSLPGSDIDTIGEIRFNPGLGDRGTEVHVTMSYVPPGGKFGHLIATVFGASPKTLIREDLRNFKRIMEVGEILTTRGQSRGTCTGQGKYEA